MRIVVALFIAIIIYSIQNRLYRRSWDKNLEVDVNIADEYIETGESSALMLTITNAKRLPLPVLNIKFSAPREFEFSNETNASVTDLYYRNDAFSVLGGQRIKRQLDFVAKKRGYFEINGINVIAKNFFMTGTFAKTVYSKTSIYVLPSKLEFEDVNLAFNDIIGDIELQKRFNEDPYTFRGIREYSFGDTMSKINWKASAKMGNLMVNQYNQTALLKVKLLLNLDTNVMIRAAYIRELSISLCSTLADKFISNKTAVALTSNGYYKDKNMAEIGFGASKNHGVAIDKCLAKINSSGEAEEFIAIIDSLKHIEDNVTYVVVSSYCKEDLLERLDEMWKNNIPVYMIVPYYDQYSINVTRPYIRGWEVPFYDS